MDPSDIVGSFRNFIYKNDLNIGEDKKNLFLQEIEKIYEEVENDYA